MHRGSRADVCSLENTMDHQPDYLRTRPAHAHERISPTANSYACLVKDADCYFLFKVFKAGSHNVTL